jgi:hypothetical protein
MTLLSRLWRPLHRLPMAEIECQPKGRVKPSRLLTKTLAM